MKRKITVTTGTRAEYGIIRPVLKSILKNKELELFLIVTGTHLSKKHGVSINEIKKDGFKIFYKFSMLPLGNTNYHMSLNLAKGIEQFSKIFKIIKPDINLVLGDRDEMLASAIAGYHLNIPNAHIHGGDKSLGGIDEYNRHAITKMSNIHFAATKKSYQRIIKMGENPKFVFNTGSPSIDEIRGNISNKKELEKKYGFKFIGKEIILLQHPVTTQTHLSKFQITQTLKAITKLKLVTIAIGPNSDAGNKEIFDSLLEYSKKYPFIHYFKNIPRKDFLGLIKNSGVMVGNSSSGIIEASYFRIPVVNIGIRQMGRERGNNVVDVPIEKVSLIMKAIKKNLNKKISQNLKKMCIYGNGNASKKIVNQLEKIKLDTKLIQKQIFY